MSGLLQRPQKVADAAISYEDSTRLSMSDLVEDRRMIAVNRSVRPEFLYLLASDRDPSVRSAVAQNAATPVQADVLLSRDIDAAVREDLAQKIARLAPGLDANETDRLRKMTYEVLDTLARDQVVKVRAIIADTLADMVDAPAEIVQRLARDPELQVAGPVLQYSPLLTDADLLEIIGKDPIAGARAAVAKRKALAPTLCDLIGASGDIDAIAALLGNTSAQIKEATLDRLVDRSPSVVAWHEPLVCRPRLPAAAAKRLATFVAKNLLGILRERRDFDPQTAREIEAEVLKRVAAEPSEENSTPDPYQAALKKAREIQASGALDEDVVDEAVVTGDRLLVRAAITVMSGLPSETTARLLGGGSAKGIVALAWKAGLSMRIAVKLQVSIARLNGSSVMKPRPDGGYPMSADSMQWHIDFMSDLADA